MSLKFLRYARCIAVCFAASLLMTEYGRAQSSEYPTRPVRLLVGFNPGGGTDITARAVGQKLAERFGQPVVIDNRPGAGGAIARELARNAAPDGYTLMVISASQVVNATLVTKDPVDIRQAFVPVTQLVWYPYVLVVNPSTPMKTVKEMIAYAKSNPRVLNYGTPGIGTTGHLATELLKHMAGIDLVHVPYKGSSASIREVMGGQIQLAYASVIGAIAHVKSGRLRAIAVSTGRRAKILPNLPTVAESGLPGYEVTGWYAVEAPARTPKDIVMKLNREIGADLESPELQKIFAADGSEAEHTTPEQLKEKINQEVEKWTKLTAAAGIKFR